MTQYERAMRECLDHYKEAISNSKQADEMMVSKTVFESTIETGGYVAPDDFNTDYSAGGYTRLYDAIIDRRQRMLDYIEQLKNNGTNARACFIILSDGKDYGSQYRASDACQAIQDLISKEITVAFIAFGQDAFGVADSIGVKKNNVKEVSNDESELRRVIDLVSKSAISASKKASSGAGGNDDGGFFDV
ncbi:MAG: hypothetical protein IJA34_07180 [Lachnospiraceae bacterium]|nr:hypothetical protein [Lachnospiraceae bacterium]